MRKFIKGGRSERGNGVGVEWRIDQGGVPGGRYRGTAGIGVRARRDLRDFGG